MHFVEKLVKAKVIMPLPKAAVRKKWAFKSTAQPSTWGSALGRAMQSHPWCHMWKQNVIDLPLFPEHPHDPKHLFLQLKSRLQREIRKHYPSFICRMFIEYSTLPMQCHLSALTPDMCALYVVLILLYTEYIISLFFSI